MELVHAHLLGGLLRRRLRVAGEHHGLLHAQLLQFGNGLRRGGLGLVRQQDRAHIGSVLRHVQRRAFRFFHARYAKFLHQPHVAHQHHRAVHLGLHAPAGQLFHAGNLRRVNFPAVSVAYRPGQGMIREMLRLGRQGNQLLPSHGTGGSVHGEQSLGERAGLVEDHRLRLGQLIQIVAALHQHALLGKGANAGKEGQRHGNHQRAGAGDYQEDQRPVNPVAPVGRGQPANHGDQHRQAAHRGGVNPGKFGNELLALGLPVGSVLHQPQHPGHFGFAVRLFHLHPDQALQVHASGKGSAAHRHGLGHGFAGQRGLIHLRVAGNHHAVQGHPLAGLDDDHVAHLHLLRLHRYNRAVLFHVGRVGTHVGQLGNGVPRPVRGNILEHFAQLIQPHYRHALSAFAGAEGAHAGYRHQEAFVKYISVGNVLDGAPQHVPSDDQIGHRKDRHLPSPLQGQKIRRHQQNRRHNQANDRPLVVLFLAAVVVVVTAAAATVAVPMVVAVIVVMVMSVTVPVFMSAAAMLMFMLMMFVLMLMVMMFMVMMLMFMLVLMVMSAAAMLMFVLMVMMLVFPHFLRLMAVLFDLRHF